MSVSAAPAIETSECDRLLDVLEAEGAAVCGSGQRIAEVCAKLRAMDGQLGEPPAASRLPRLARIVSSRVAAANAPVIALLCDIAERIPDAWPILGELLGSHDAQVIASALSSIRRIAAVRPAFIGHRLLHGLAEHFEGEGGTLAGREALETIASLIRVAESNGAASLEELYSGATDRSVRRLAARLLDLEPRPPSSELAERILGVAMANWLSPYLAWTRATHADLLALESGAPAAVFAALQEAERVCGEKLLREIVGEIGWAHLNFGLVVQRYSGISIAGSYPLLVSPAEARLLDDIADKERIFDRFLVIAHGGDVRSEASSQRSEIALFRAYNLTHAELLAAFLDVAPLTVDKVRWTIARMDRIVDDFQSLFASRTDECPTLTAVYADLKSAIEQALAKESAAPGKPLSPELTRLVGMFDDPHSLADVRTLHGLKRYLHQRGLKLGMLLAESGGAAGRRVTFALATPERVLQTRRAIEYVDFEPEHEEPVPFAVQIVVDEFSRQLVHAEQPLPKVKVFCYGNEVHYFIAYRNHPAFVRIDYSPPGRGGMIDLAYFGVSKYELSAHPAPALPAVERFFRRLDFDVEIDATHVHARYDKERAFDLADLCERASSLFRLAPYLMDIDWVIGDLALSQAGRNDVATAWSEFFATWGVLPYAQFLTADRCGILAGIESDAAGEREQRWSGSAAYRDRFHVDTPGTFWDRVRAAAASRGLGQVLRFESNVPLAQLVFEERVLRPLHDASARGEVIVDDDVRAQTPELFQRKHAADCLGGVLQSDSETIGRSAQLAAAVAVLAPGLRFRTIGAVNGYDVQKASLPLPGRRVGLYALRDASGIFRLALCARGDSLHLIRKAADAAWMENWSFDTEWLVHVLRLANYPTPAAETKVTNAIATAEQIVPLFQTRNPHARLPPLTGERVVAGVIASPGRAVGLARLGVTDRRPSEVDGAILVCPSMSPADGAFLGTAAGVVTTGGGALSHAGLLALQHGKPALIIAGRWNLTGPNLRALTYRTLSYDEQHHDTGGYRISERHNFSEREERLREGDLLVLDADDGLLRILGQEPDAIALNDSLCQLALASRQLGRAGSDSEVLVERGRRLRARHQLEKVLGRISNPVLARHAAAELLLRNSSPESNIDPAEKKRLLNFLLENPVTGSVAREAVRLLAERLLRRLAAELDHAQQLIRNSASAWEILSIGSDVRLLSDVATAARDLVTISGIAIESDGNSATPDLRALAEERFRELRTQLIDRADTLSGDIARLRHVADELHRIDVVLGTEGGERATAALVREAVAVHDRRVEWRLAGRRVIDASAGGLEIRAAAGSKAANLAQLARLGEGSLVPPWFVVTDCAFRDALDSPVAEVKAHSLSGSVRAVVESVLARADLTNGQKSAAIREAWEAAQLPGALVDEVRNAYRTMAACARVSESAAGHLFVAVRSSASEEDLETAARAGEFDTFLFVSGEDALITYLKRAWSGLWSERALHSRAVFGFDGSVGGGIIVQKMVASRASGVLHTVNVAERRLREMVISAGLGVGEGIVSGAVAADRIVVSKEGDLEHGELHFRYLTADKRERFVFNSRLGSGTARVETLYHQRLRPALEYVEICQLVSAAARLEAAYCYPLDIEFAVEGTDLYLLQVRPIPAPFAAWKQGIQ